MIFADDRNRHDEMADDLEEIKETAENVSDMLDDLYSRENSQLFEKKEIDEYQNPCYTDIDEYEAIVGHDYYEGMDEELMDFF